MLSQLGQIAVHVADLDRAVAFYRDILEVPFLFGFPGLAFFDCAGVRLMLSQPEGGEVHGRASVLYFKVPDIEVEARRLASHSVTFDQAPHLVANCRTTICGWPSSAIPTATCWR